jgi:hypothetical protein
MVAVVMIAAVAAFSVAAVMSRGSAAVVASKATSADLPGGGYCQCHYGHGADQQILDHRTIPLQDV